MKSANTSQEGRGDRPLLVLDLDETLVFSVEEPLARSPEHRVGPFHVYQRPHLHRFLTEIAVHYDVAVWSAGTDDYVQKVVAAAKPEDLELAFVWGRNRCTYRRDLDENELYFVKDLKKVRRKGYSLARTLIVEDTPRKVERHYGNAIYVTSWEGEEDDFLLLDLLEYLRSIHAEPNFRRIEKRGWRHFRHRR